MIERKDSDGYREQMTEKTLWDGYHENDDREERKGWDIRN